MEGRAHIQVQALESGWAEDSSAPQPGHKVSGSVGPGNPLRRILPLWPSFLKLHITNQNLLFPSEVTAFFSNRNIIFAGCQKIYSGPNNQKITKNFKKSFIIPPSVHIYC